MAEELEMTSGVISFRGHSRKVTEVRTGVTRLVSRPQGSAGVLEILYLDLESGYMATYVYQKALSCP